MSQKIPPRPAWHEDEGRYIRWQITNMDAGATLAIADVLVHRVDSARYDVITHSGYGKRRVYGRTGHASHAAVADVQAEVLAALGYDEAQEVA